VKPFSSNTGTSRTDAQSEYRTSDGIGISVLRVITAVLTRDKNRNILDTVFFSVILMSNVIGLDIQVFKNPPN